MAVHPRSRGEQPLKSGDNGRTGGSSPLARGTEACRASKPIPRRFIPARAGNRTLTFPPDSNPTVHPRSHGEQFKKRCFQPLYFGSSPLARGTEPQSFFWDYLGRFIPARAGNRPHFLCRRRPKPVHPRSRGEQGHRAGHHDLDRGSSPLARGTAWSSERE